MDHAIAGFAFRTLTFPACIDRIDGYIFIDTSSGFRKDKLLKYEKYSNIPEFQYFSTENINLRKLHSDN
uniref:Uncharacterized protein n=1 Tax=Romanomermis culicivorax TaxID=13658 RepID=A0A915JMB2_ROMCU